MVIGSVHDEFYFFGYLAEFANDKFVAIYIKMVCYVFFKIFIAEISKFSDKDIGVFNSRFDVSDLLVSFDGINCVGIRLHTNIVVFVYQFFFYVNTKI